LGDSVSITWTEPIIQGSPITGYRIYIQESDGVSYSLELSDCDGSNTVIRDAQTCSVTVLTLQTTPFSLIYGSSIWAKVVAYNVYGDSVISDTGNGAVIYTYADAPLDLAEDESQRSASSITFTWIEGADNSGSTVFDYRVSYDNAVGVYQDLADGIVVTSYTATGLTYGETYTFRVEAQNTFGYSAYSEVVAILCATYPEQPDAPTTTISLD
jgi:hypothetical protein